MENNNTYKEEFLEEISLLKQDLYKENSTRIALESNNFVYKKLAKYIDNEAELTLKLLEIIKNIEDTLLKTKV